MVDPIKTDRNLNIIFEKEYSLNECTVFNTKVIETKEGYYLGLDVCTDNGNDYNYCIVKTDLLGNKLWHRFYGTPDKYDVLFTIKKFKT